MCAQDVTRTYSVSGTGTSGDAFARVESVEAISGKGIHTLLHPMTILFPESKVTAIMGPSGSGKTTFLNFLTGTVASSRNNLSEKLKVWDPKKPLFIRKLTDKRICFTDLDPI